MQISVSCLFTFINIDPKVTSATKRKQLSDLLFLFQNTHKNQFLDYTSFQSQVLNPNQQKKIKKFNKPSLDLCTGDIHYNPAAQDEYLTFLSHLKCSVLFSRISVSYPNFQGGNISHEEKLLHKIQ